MTTFLDLLKEIEPVVQVLTLSALVVYVWKTWTMASATRKSAIATEKSATASELSLREMKLSREQEAQPYVICYFDSDPNFSRFYDLVIANVGRSMAFDVAVAFVPPIESYAPNRSKETIEKRIFKAMAPRYEWRTHWGSFIQDDESRYPESFEAAISFTWGPARTVVKYPVSFDIQSLKGRSWIYREPMGEALGKIAKELKEIERQLRDANARAVEGQEEIDEPESPS